METNKIFEDIDEAKAFFESDRTNGKKYMLFGNQVLDVTDFQHPGPQNLIDENLETDMKDLFIDQEHSDYAMELIQKLAIGHIQESAPIKGKLMQNDYIPEGMSKEEEEIHKRLDKMVDITKPLLPQIKKMTNREFMAFVRRPRHIDDQDGIILYEDLDYDESRKRSYERNVAVMAPVSILYLSLSYYLSQTNVEFFRNFLIYFMVGLGIVWTYTEYYFHRHVLHKEVILDPNAEADGEYNAAIFSRHLHHHVFMNQYYRIVLFFDSYIHVGLISVALLLILPATIVLMAVAGWFIGSLAYDGMHMAFHFNWYVPIPGFDAMKSAHMRHHFRDNSKEFGVTTPIWDWVCGTTREKSSKWQ